MNLREKLIMVSAFTYILVFVGFFLVTDELITNGYLELESGDIVEQTEIGLNTLELRISELNHVSKEYASRDDTYYFVQNNMRHFINDLIQSSSFIENEINFMIFFNQQGEVLYSKAFDLAELMNMELDERVLDAIYENDALFDHQDRNSEVSGLIKSDKGSVIISSHPITYSDEDFAIIGTLICGRYVDLIELAKICDYSYQNIQVFDFMDSPIEMDDGINVWRKDEDNVSGLVALDDINGDPFLILEVDSPRDLYNQGRKTVLYFFAVMLITGAVIGVFAVYMLNKMVLGRILGLSDEVSSIDPRSLEAKSLSIPGDDEIAKLSMDIDGMLQTINDYQDLLKKQERMATIGETAAMVGHDLRNPLQVIYMLASRLSRASRQLRKNENVNPIVNELDYIEKNLSEQTGYMNKIVSDLQDFSKSIALNIEKTDIQSMVIDVLDTVEVPQNVELIVDFDDKTRLMDIDGNYFRRVLVNLLTNAVHAMPDGGKLSVIGKASDDKAVITVSDTGVGVSKENLPKLFTPLFTTKAKGTGLGLAVCKRIIDAHNGEIRVDSTEGVGTTFTILLAFNEVEDISPNLLNNISATEEAYHIEK